jgi:hypothetical protein
MTIWKRIRNWRRRAEFEAGLEEEMRFHREMAGGAAFGSVAMAPGFALAVVGTIGAALGLNTTVFTVVNAYALRPFAVHDPWGLYNFTWYGKNGQGHRFTRAQYQDLVTRKNPFSDVLATENIVAEVDGRTLFGQLVSGNYFTMLEPASWKAARCFRGTRARRDPGRSW